MGGAVAKARKFTLTRIRQALDAVGLTTEQRRKFLDYLNTKPAPKGRPSNYRRALAEQEDQEDLEQRLGEWRANRYKAKKGPPFSADPDDS
jgi:hypothetical protein